MSNTQFPIITPPMLSPEEWLMSLESLMLTLLSTSQTTAAALAHVLALVDLTLLMASTPVASAVVQTSPSMVQATTATIPLPPDLSNLPAFLEAYKVQAAANAKAETEARLHPTIISCLCPFLPPIYHRAHGTGCNFINACNLYVGLCPEQFSDDYITISWALTFMQQGQAAEFVARVFQFGGMKKLFQDWDQFLSIFADEFYDPNKVVNASLVLKLSSYYQNGYSIDMYINSFKLLWNQSQYLDRHHLIMKFQQGMDSDLNQHLGTITTGCPNDTKVDE
ncbi:hypothetical protein DXG03_002943 [Asterophora parasitica]|uniref:Retrotransposon gag domain-containing protein n=1 Tax=Asterophora parasitica TaxID=117018 RepID=A0A9P7FYY6_9AGAR|nr:hypothetical protein DXG03_002943 [Asterophora parasitica]